MQPKSDHCDHLFKTEIIIYNKMFENGKWQYAFEDVCNSYNWAFARCSNSNRKIIRSSNQSLNENNECKYAINVLWRASHVELPSKMDVSHVLVVAQPKTIHTVPSMDHKYNHTNSVSHTIPKCEFYIILGPKHLKRFFFSFIYWKRKAIQMHIEQKIRFLQQTRVFKNGVEQQSLHLSSLKMCTYKHTHTHIYSKILAWYPIAAVHAVAQNQQNKNSN